MTENRCNSRTRYGHCGRATKHDGEHAVPIGVDFWFAYTTGGRRAQAIGYGRYVDGRFQPYVNERPTASCERAVIERAAAVVPS